MRSHIGTHEHLSIDTTDAPGFGGARHRYEITGFNTENNPSRLKGEAGEEAPSNIATVLFQNGTISDLGWNGVTNEVLLLIVADRLRSFQGGPFSCRENALALTKIEEALHWLDHRTQARRGRGVEGTHTP